MKVFKLFVFLFLTQTCFSQVNPLQINFGQLNFDILDEPLTQEHLETILNTFSAFGDKEVILKEVISSFLIAPNNVESDSLIYAWLDDFSEEDSIKLSQLPAIDKDYRARAFNVVWMSYFVKADIENISVIESMINTSKDKNEKFPNYPKTDQYSGMLAVINNFHAFSKWSLKYPDEFKFFMDKMEKMTIDAMGSYSNENLVKYVDSVIKKVRDNRLIYELYLPYPMEMFFMALANEDTEEPSFAKFCDSKNIDGYLKNAYKIIFDETLSKDGLLILKDYIVENDLYNPQVIYLSLIMSKYE